MKSIFEKTKLNNLELKNRLFRSGTWECLAGKDGSLNEEIYNIYEELAAGGVGAIITGLVDVSTLDWALKGNMRLCDDSHISDYKHLTDLVHQYDCKIIPQLNLNKYIKQFDDNLIEVNIDDLTHEEMNQIVSLFSDAALRAKKAGFDAIQIHCCFKWLLSRLLNPKYNHRTDKYGGSPENRIRLTLEILDEIKRNLPNMHISIKIGFYGNIENKDELLEFATICKKLAEHGIDSIEVTSNDTIIGATKQTEGIFLPIALAVQEQVDIPIILVGGHRDIDNMKNIISETPIEYLSLSRSLIREPDLPNRWQNGENSKSLCISCDKCYRIRGKRCKFNVKKRKINRISK